jgi:iron complex transport system substrate-binding protein
VVARGLLTPRHEQKGVTICVLPAQADWLRRDLPDTIPDEAQRSRVSVVEQSVFEPSPASDAVFISRAFKALPDADAAHALRRAAENLLPGGRVLLVEETFGTDDLDEYDGEADLIALTAHGSGLRTPAELDAVITRAGLAHIATHTVGGDHRSRTCARRPSLTPFRTKSRKPRTPMTTIFLRRRGVALGAAFLSAALLLAACSNSDDPGRGVTSGEMRSFEADNGTIEIPIDPQRIIGIQRGARNSLAYGIEPVGLGQLNEDPDWLSPEQRAVYDETPQVADWSTVDYEEIASLEPDLIVISTPDFLWEENWDDERLKSIAPTVYIETSNEDWKVQEERIADAIGQADAFNARKAEYDGLIEEMRTKYADLLESETMVPINRYGGAEDGEFQIEDPLFYCTTFGTELGVEFPVLPDSTGAGSFVSMEQIGDLAQYDVILYPQDPGGGPKEELLPIVESNSWQALPQVASGRALSVTCTGGLSYPDGITYLESLDDALSTLPAE